MYSAKEQAAFNNKKIQIAGLFSKSKKNLHAPGMWAGSLNRYCVRTEYCMQGKAPQLPTRQPATYYNSFICDPYAKLRKHDFSGRLTKAARCYKKLTMRAAMQPRTRLRIFLNKKKVWELPISVTYRLSRARKRLWDRPIVITAYLGYFGNMKYACFEIQTNACNTIAQPPNALQAGKQCTRQCRKYMRCTQ